MKENNCIRFACKINFDRFFKNKFTSISEYIKIAGFASLFLITSCVTKHKDNKNIEGHEITPTYAEGFSITEYEDYRILKINHTGKSANGYDEFKLIDRSKIEEGKNIDGIPVPCKRIICLSSTQLTYFYALDDIDPVVGINSSRHHFNPKMKKALKEGTIKKVGKEGAFNIELIASLNPDLILVSPFKAGGFDALINLGFNLVPMAAYEEETPLGRAEWVKMISLFLGREQQADSLFASIEQRYDSLRTIASAAKERPTIFSGIMKSGNWYVPGGNSFYAHYFRDAGAQYVFNDDKKGASPMSFEAVYEKAAHSDYWRILLPAEAEFDKQSLLTNDVRYGDFDAYKNDKIIVCRMRQRPYYEESAIKPDVILADYIHHLHPELLPGYKPYFYEILK